MRTYATPQTRVLASPVIQQQAPGILLGANAPVVERKLFYIDPVTGNRMMKVCTPNGTVKRVEVLNESQEEHVNNQLDLETEGMILDAKEEFTDAVRESFDVEDCKLDILI